MQVRFVSQVYVKQVGYGIKLVLLSDNVSGILLKGWLTVFFLVSSFKFQVLFVTYTTIQRLYNQQ